MSFITYGRSLLHNNQTLNFILHTNKYSVPLVLQARGFAVLKAVVKPTPVVNSETKKGVIPAETDPQKLHDYVCGSNLVKENRQDIKVKENHEYPDWLWQLRTGKAPPIEEMDKDTKQYWRRMRTQALIEKNKLKKNKKF